MGKQFKVIRVSNHWSTEKLRKDIEEALNKASKQDWELVDISFLANTMVAMITISK